MLGLDIRAAVLAGFVASKENHSTCLFCIAFKHGSPALFRGIRPSLGRLRARLRARCRCFLDLRKPAVFEMKNPVRPLGQ